MWGNPTLFQHAKSIGKKYWEKVNVDTINWKKFFLPGKSYWKKYWEKIDIGTINWKKLFGRSAEHK